MTVLVQTFEYEYSHGHLPRGKGQWGFYFGNDRGTIWWASIVSIYYSEAKKLAIAEAKKRGATSIKVAS